MMESRSERLAGWPSVRPILSIWPSVAVVDTGPCMERPTNPLQRYLIAVFFHLKPILHCQHALMH